MWLSGLVWSLREHSTTVHSVHCVAHVFVREVCVVMGQRQYNSLCCTLCDPCVCWGSVCGHGCTALAQKVDK